MKQNESNLKWNTYKNDKGEVYPDLWQKDKDNLKRMLIRMEKSGVKELDFSNWSFTGVVFNEEITNLMRFADKINFQNALFCYCSFSSCQFKNVDFSGASFTERCLVSDSKFYNCNFKKTMWENPTAWNGKEAPDKDMNGANIIADSTFVGCKFKDAQLKNTRLYDNKFISISNVINKFKQSMVEKAKANKGFSIHEKLKKNKQELKLYDDACNAKQHDYRQEER